MKWIPETSTLELTSRNVTALNDKLNDPLSARTLISPDPHMVPVTAVESAGAAEAIAAPGAVVLTRTQLVELTTEGATVRVGAVRVRSVADDAHYADRLAGEVYMPSTGEYR
ncbi:hypothetical protein C5U48_02610 [Mycolicibacter virginiensis]|uniref:Uncharacterized protein n=1 Tax=Mycolicibacter virginiensis TaxID=1795032 RepID=A0A9X7IQV7_9MYCO|nr:hypothetical protein [Mycolicibacter virginiensis]PQM53721.1 hypothetical protein C5U48_02610 [Mycolicibacter virginiensis]